MFVSILKNASKQYHLYGFNKRMNYLLLYEISDVSC